MGYTIPTPIQRDAIPVILAGRDVVGCAQTGTGKTAAFVLPLLQRIPAKPGAIKALIVTPTRELAVQIDEVARAAARSTRHRTAVVYGGVGYDPQRRALKRGVDVLVATPGRLLDLVNRRDADLSKVEVLVLDEADRMLDMGFAPDVKRIMALLPEKRQNLLFSATMPKEILKLIDSTLDNPAHISVAPVTTPIEAIAQSIYPVGSQQKGDLLKSLIDDHNLGRVLVFTRTKHRADRVARQLERSGIRSAAIHGNRSQAQRQKALDGFKRGHSRVLVATDIVARGIDVDNITHVINFDVPNTPEDYVHRIGRTARAGRSGSAFTLFSPEEHDSLRDIEFTIGSVLDCTDHDGFCYRDSRMLLDPEREAVRGRGKTPRSGAKNGGGGRAGSGNPRSRGRGRGPRGPRAQAS
ncbi:MAG: DEAD/DEAH box helicase [Coriobacteriia bacterium]|nr:DEAD/DEAH box helicase [Coriobacteriia bacterium]